MSYWSRARKRAVVAARKAKEASARKAREAARRAAAAKAEADRIAWRPRGELLRLRLRPTG